MIVTVSPAASLLRPLLTSLGALALGLGISAMTIKPEETTTTTTTTLGRSAVLAFPSADRRSDVRVELHGERLLLSGVRSSSPWSRAGLQDGDVIVSVDGEGVADLPRVLDLLSSSPRHSVSFTRDTRAGVAHLDLDFTISGLVDRPAPHSSNLNP
jgi:S1-C subfamily serine protease